MSAEPESDSPNWDAAWEGAHFAAFFKAVHGVPPFPWQQRLAGRLLGGGNWPRQLDLPTATGKTAALDIALFHLAAELHAGVKRTAPVRIAFVVDRRLIVDDAFARAAKIAETLKKAEAAAEPVRRVAEALSKLVEPARPGEKANPPLLVRRLRGGVPREDDWARTPAQPTILTSTVDQVGSRLLFRGYGVSDRMAPIHAGLIGADCLILLDEAHLSRPFEQTLASIAKLGGGTEPGGRPLQWAVMTATPAHQVKCAEDAFGLDEADLANETLARRLDRPKPALLLEVKSAKTAAGTDDAEEDGEDDTRRRRTIERDRVQAIVKQVEAALAHFGGLDAKLDGASPVVGVVVNRVLRARAVHDALAEAYAVPADGPGRDGVRLSLVIGPARAADRERLAEQDLAPIKTSQDDARKRLTGPMVVVATQTIEAGVDLDFDALITEVAALDALRQRFGRLNRAGRAIEPYAAVLAHPRDDLKPKGTGDPIYGLAAAATWARLLEWRGEAPTLDLSQTALGPLVADLGEAGREPLLTPKTDAPVLMPAHIDLWSQTAPAPACDPEPALYLHGPGRPDPRVRIAWRADLTEQMLTEGSEAWLHALTEAAPLKAAETVEVSLAAARQWASPTRAMADFADAPMLASEPPEPRGGQPLLRVGREKVEVLNSARALCPGDLLVAPAGYGGCDRFGWAPASRLAVADVGEIAAWPFRSTRYAVRLNAARLAAARFAAPLEEDEPRPERQKDLDAWEAVITAKAHAAWSAFAERVLAADGADDRVGKLGELFAKPELHPDLDRLLQPFSTRAHLRRGRVELLYPYANEDDENRFTRGLVVVAPHGLTSQAAPPPWDDADRDDDILGQGEAATEDDAIGSFDRKPLSLARHSLDVKEFAGRFAEKAGLSAQVVADLALAGWLHDAGKADPRFQRYLGGGDPLGIAGEPLAKSGRRSAPGDAERAGLPDHWRHEALSVRLALHNPKLAAARDPGLVLWLVGTHHGHGRPLFPHAHALRDQRPAEPPALGGLVGPGHSGHLPGPESLAFALPDEPAFDRAAAGGEDLRALDWAQLFERLKRRYGVWGLAHLEAVVRLADHRASEHADRREEKA